MKQLELWSKCSKNLENSLSQDEFNTWIRPLKANKTKDTLELIAPNDFILNYLEKNFADNIQELVKKYSTTVYKPEAKWCQRPDKQI